MNFTCPYCNKPTTATSPHVFNDETQIVLERNSDLDQVYLVTKAISCPNEKCNKLFLRIFLANKNWSPSISRYVYDKKYEWQLLPESQAKILPDYIPAPIKEDYYQACRIRDLSSKASSTLARRCLQGMIRDFWTISKSTLKEEIDALEEKVDPTTWEAIDAVRSVGNIGAHMEKDINLIIDVEPNEAQLLIELIEQLVDDWYVQKNDRQERMKKVKQLAEEKKQKKIEG
jgi:hypothetical protein